MPFSRPAYRMSVSVSLITLLLLTFLGAAAGNADNLVGLLAEAERRQLYDERYWHTLLHYRKTAFGTKSLIDDPDFFMAADGKTDPRTELATTIAALFQSGTSIEGLICRFPARFAWLDEHLNLNRYIGRDPVCTEFEELYQTIQPKSVTLIFPAAFMNNPASMFGHTMLTVDSATESRLLSHAITYHADTNEETGPIFTFKGIFGLYHGFFSMMPYYKKVQEYSDIAQRDIWEYKLNFREPEIKALLLHLWELRDIYADYFFFGENCAFNLLFLLEAGRPELELVDRFRYWTTPIDTVKQIDRLRVIDSVHYRPSKATRMQFMAAELDHDQLILAEAILKKGILPSDADLTALTNGRRSKLLDLVIEGAQYRYAKKEWSKDAYLNVFLDALTLRSAIGGPSPNIDDKILQPARPDRGHNTRRLTIGIKLIDSDQYAVIGFQPAYHDLTDPPGGYVPGSQIRFLNTVLRVDERIALDRLDIVDVVSLCERDRLFRPFSWRLSTGLVNKYFGNDDEHLLYRVGGGCGIGFHYGWLGLAYGFVETDLLAGGALAHGHSLGMGVTAGVLRTISDLSTLHISLSRRHYEVGHEHTSTEFVLSQGFHLSTNTNLLLEYRREIDFETEIGMGQISWQWYF